MRALIFILTLLVFCSTSYAFEGLQDGDSLKIFNRINCSTGLTCSRGANGLFTMTSDVSTAGDGSSSIYGFLSYLESATTETIAIADCMKTYVATSTAAIELPEASTALGCRYTFVVATEGALVTVNPDDADTIILETNAAGDSITSETLGNSIVLEAVSATQWAPIAHEGTWADAN